MTIQSPLSAWAWYVTSRSVSDTYVTFALSSGGDLSTIDLNLASFAYAHHSPSSLNTAQYVWVVDWAKSAHGIAASATAQAIKRIRRPPIDAIADDLYSLAPQDLFGILARLLVTVRRV